LLLWTLLCTAQVTFARVALRPWPAKAWRWRGRWLRRWGRGFCRIAGVRLVVEGAPPGEPFFLVSNHQSYLDIPVFGAVANVVFVAKSEVASWPVLGVVCRAADTIFVVRSSRRDSVRANAVLDGHLEAGHAVLLFPEGRTSDGSGVQPFRPPLLQAPARRAQPVHAAAVDYSTANGDPPSAVAVCWWGEMPLLPHLWTLLGLTGITARLRFSQWAVQESDRKLLAARLHGSVTRLWRDGRREEKAGSLARSSQSHPGSP
jgi:1-acyl-sn-glycerol-3-phosphate acyltransferase